MANLRNPNLTGKIFERLTALTQVVRSSGHVAYRCLCTCGEIRLVNSRHLLSGHTKSCGCLRKEVLSVIKSTHGKRHTSEYNVWASLKSRCSNVELKAYARYGGRGIYVCEDWLKSFEKFLSDMGPRPSLMHSIEREDNDGPYSKDNCKWATKKEQANNRKSNRFVVYQGKEYTIAQFADFTRLTYSCVYSRLIKNGWTTEDCVRGFKR